MENSKISIQNLNMWFGKQKILNNVNIEIPENKLTVILGPSGCGKTTLMKTLNRLVDLQGDAKVDGKIMLDGEDILNTTRYNPGPSKDGLVIATAYSTSHDHIQ
jgi:phosphate transport system ATP-binding protein